MSKKVILIRHGRTKWNAEKRYMGSTDVGLDDIGKRQAVLLRNKLSGISVDKVYSSDSSRASDFAGIIFGSERVNKLRELREMSFGIIEGMTHEEIMLKYPEEYSGWLNDIHSACIPEGESLQQLKSRVLKAFNEIVAANETGSLAIVTHAGPIRVIINEIHHEKDFWSVMPDASSVSMIEFNGKCPKVILVNDTSHLSGEKYG